MLVKSTNDKNQQKQYFYKSKEFVESNYKKIVESLVYNREDGLYYDRINPYK